MGIRGDRYHLMEKSKAGVNCYNVFAIVLLQLLLRICYSTTPKHGSCLYENTEGSAVIQTIWTHGVTALSANPARIWCRNLKRNPTAKITDYSRKVTRERLGKTISLVDCKFATIDAWYPSVRGEECLLPCLVKHPGSVHPSHRPHLLGRSEENSGTLSACRKQKLMA